MKKRSYLYWLPIVLTVLIFGSTCSKKETQQQDSGTNHLNFDVDTALLEPAYADTVLGIKFAPPKNWKPVPAAVVDSLFGGITSAQAQMKPHRMFMDDSLKSGCVITMLQSVEIDSTHQILAAAAQTLKALDPQTEIKSAEFYTGTFRVRQVLAISPALVTFRLIFDHPATKIFQVDYIIPRAIYGDLIKAVESSIGSIQPLEVTSTS